MKLAGDYTFDAPVSDVWKALLDPEVLAGVMPGCDKLELDDEGAYIGALNIKIGPVQGKFQGKVNLENLEDEKGYTMKVDGRGAPGFVKATAPVALEAVEGGKTKMTYEADAKVGGKVASVGQRLIEASAKAIIQQSLDGLHEAIKARATGTSAPVEKPTQAQFAAAVAKEVAKEVVPTPVRYGLVVAAVAAIAAAVYFFTS